MHTTYIRARVRLDVEAFGVEEEDLLAAVEQRDPVALPGLHLKKTRAQDTSTLLAIASAARANS